VEVSAPAEAEEIVLQRRLGKNGRHRERERERGSRGGGWKKKGEEEQLQMSAIGVGYSGRAALRRGQCGMYAREVDVTQLQKRVLLGNGRLQQYQGRVFYGVRSQAINPRERSSSREIELRSWRLEILKLETSS
jgi:hypothetical protein